MGNYEYMFAKQIPTCGRYPLSLAQVRNLLINRHKNGLAKAVRKIGKRILIRVDLFESWLEAQVVERTDKSYARGQK